MPINKKFPNYTKSLIAVKVISSHTPGNNRASHRRMVALAREYPEFKRRKDARDSREDQRQIKYNRIQKRHESNRQRSAKRKKFNS